jgi:hypothetical protein
MKVTIKKGWHYPFPYFGIPVPILIRRNKLFNSTKQFMFTESCLYDFKDDDQHDVNKLFGFSIGFHHKNSFRFGWRPNADLTKIEIVGYEYHQGTRIPTISICEVEINKWYEYRMRCYNQIGTLVYFVDDGYKIIGIADSVINSKHRFNWGYKLGLYFGGNKKAPHNIIIYKK